MERSATVVRIMPFSPTVPDDRELQEGIAIVNSIASFLTLSDAATPPSVAAEASLADSWAVGVEFEPEESSWSVATPFTPALVALSPDEEWQRGDFLSADDALTDADELDMQGRLRERRMRWAQEKLTAAVFLHPGSLRSFCLEAYVAAQELQKRKLASGGDGEEPETLVEPPENRHRDTVKNERLELLLELSDLLLRNVPFSVLIDVAESGVNVSTKTTVASFCLVVSSVDATLSGLHKGFRWTSEGVTNFNPLRVLEAVISLQFSAMGRTSEVLASGLQSVATGVGSASSMALHRLSAASLSANMTGSSSSLIGKTINRRTRGSANAALNTKLVKKLSKINDASRVVSYREVGDDTGGLTKHAINRTRRMMHYSVSLRPFLATVTVPAEQNNHRVGHEAPNDSERSASSSEPVSPESPFMCTPQSFPPTPHSRHIVLSQKSRFSDDVVFLARDRLRIHDNLGSENERTRQMAKALSDGKRLAVFDSKDTANGIQLTCGQHIATKVGNMYYSSTRSMVPILRNCFVYFEVTVLPPAIGDLPLHATMATLSIGLSTEEMPPNTLVGAWQGSVGLCTTGQILTAGQWCSPADPSLTSYGAGATVGCLVCLDDDSACETWDGLMASAFVTFTVNGKRVAPPVSALPMPGVATSQPRPRDVLNGGTADFGETMLPNATLTLLVPAAEDLYPTVTLQTAAASVMCHFSSEDVVMAGTRESINVPPNTAVYAVDGSVIIKADEHRQDRL